MAKINHKSNRNAAAATKLLLISVDSDPKSELSLSHQQPVNWNTIVDALTKSKYCFATRRLPPPSDHNLPNNRSKIRSIKSRTKVAYLTLYASKKAAFFYHHNDVVDTNYQISYDDEKLMNDLPSFSDLKGLPRFHLFMSLPEDLRLSIVKLVDGAVFARLRCVSRELSRLDWNSSFNILRYSHPDFNLKIKNVRVEELKDECNGDGEGSFSRRVLLRLSMAVCFVAVVYSIANEVRSVPVYEFDDIGDEDYEDYEDSTLNK